MLVVPDHSVACLANALQDLNDFSEVPDVEDWQDEADMSKVPVAVL
jgi:hypothetical protein